MRHSLIFCMSFFAHKALESKYRNPSFRNASFVSDMNQRLCVLENKDSPGASPADEEVKALTALMQTMRIQLDEVRGELNVRQAWAPSNISTKGGKGASSTTAPLHSGQPSPTSNRQSSGVRYSTGVLSSNFIPPSERMEALCGSLGWNTQDTVLVQLLKILFDEVGVPSDSWHVEFCELPTGSTVKLIFRSAQERRPAELRIKRAEKHFCACAPDKLVYLGPRKTSL